jgi:putative pyruvate formate lyase activating enzyme
MDRAAHQEATGRANQAQEALCCCRLCPRQCEVNRIAGEKGYCWLDNSVRCFREMLYCYEEEQLNPSHQIYFAGCNLRCEFCTVSEWNGEPWMAREMNIESLSQIIARRRMEGAKTLSLLGGEPAVNLHGILRLLAQVEQETQVVWNSNMYYSAVVDELMAGLIDVYLPDLKCGNNQCSKALLGAENYMEVAKRNTLAASEHGDVIVRHVVLPGHIECCAKAVLNWLAEEMPQTKLSLRSDYVPPAESMAAPTKYLREVDFRKVEDLAGKMGLNLVK